MEHLTFLEATGLVALVVIGVTAVVSYIVHITMTKETLDIVDRMDDRLTEIHTLIFDWEEKGSHKEEKDGDT